MNIDIGSKIKTLRLSKSMTQEQLAKALHVSAQAVSKWENGSSLPDIQLLPALSVTLGTSIDSLFSLTDESRFTRIDNMLWDKRFLTQQEFDEEEHFLQEKCREEETRPRATLLLAELYCKRAREYNDLASPLARQALALNLDCKAARTSTGTRRTTTARSPSIRSFSPRIRRTTARTCGFWTFSSPTAAARRRARSWTKCTA